MIISPVHLKLIYLIYLIYWAYRKKIKFLNMKLSGSKSSLQKYITNFSYYNLYFQVFVNINIIIIICNSYSCFYINVGNSNYEIFMIYFFRCD